MNQILLCSQKYSQIHMKLYKIIIKKTKINKIFPVQMNKKNDVYSVTSLYQRVQIISLIVMVATISSSLNSRTIVVGFSPFCS